MKNSSFFFVPALLLIVAFFFPKPLPYKYEIAIAAIFQDEAPWFKEWLEYHRMLGVEHFRLYNNESRDNSVEVLKPYIEKGIVTLIDWPTQDVGSQFQGFVHHTQIPAYKDAIEAFKGVAKWVAVIDIDEFIVPHEASTLNAFLKKYRHYGGVAIHWVLYGTSNVADIPNDQLFIETLVMRSSDCDEANLYEKSIVRPEYVKHVVDPHFFIMGRLAPLVNANEESHQHFKTSCHGKIQINHYHVRTLNYFWNSKIAKKQQMENFILPQEEIDHLLTMGNHHLDDEKYIFRFIPALKERLK